MSFADIIKRSRQGMAAQRTAAETGIIDPSWARDNPDAASAAMTRAQWDQYVRDFVPVENELLGKANSTGWIERAADQAGDTVRASAGQAASSLADTLQRRGAVMTDAQRKSVARRQDIQTSLDASTAENTTRRDLRDTRTNLVADTLAVGRGIQKTASSATDTAAGLAGQRAAAGRANSASTKQNLSSGLVTAGVMTGNPALAGAGVVVGLL